MLKICNVYNSAAHYRMEIFMKMDATFDCRFVFGKAPIGGKDIKSIPTEVFKNARIVKNKVFIKAPLYWQVGVFGELLKPTDAYIMLGEPYCISTWFFALLARYVFRKRVLFWSHGWYGREGIAKRLLKKIFFRIPNATLLYGNYAKQLMVTEGFDAKQLFVIHNSLAYTQQLKIRDSIKPTQIYFEHFGNYSRNIVFIGRLTKVKSLDNLIRMLPELKRLGTDANITFVGDGTERETLMTLSKELGVENRVWFYGASYDELKNAEFLYNADLCVSPGNVGLTAIHALMFGCPVATHNNFKSQMPEFEAITEGVTGTFFNDKDVPDMARSVNAWFNTGTPRSEVREACFREIDSSWNPYFQLEVLRHAVSECYNE